MHFDQVTVNGVNSNVLCGLLREDEKNACKYYNYGTDPWILCLLIYKSIKNSKEGKHMGCSGCSGNCGSCCGCSGAAFKGNVQTTGKKKQLR